MTPFEFRTVPEIIFQPGGTQDLGRIISERFTARDILIVTDAGLAGSGLLDAPIQSLTAAGLEVRQFDGVVADPPEEIVQGLADLAASWGDLIIGFGGGSSMDAAKLAAVLAKGVQKLDTMYGVGNVTSPRLPLVQIPTTAGTGSEVTPISIVTTGETTKMGVVSPVLYADMALLDPDLTLSLPPHVTAATGIDAMVHAIEAFTSRHKKNPLSDTLAKRALSLLHGNLALAYGNGSDRDARSACLLGSMLAGQAFANAPVAAVHALAYPLGGIFHLPHGLSNALVLPHVLAFNLPAAAPLYGDLYTHLSGEDAGSPEQNGERFLTLMNDLCAQVGLDKGLRDFGIARTDIARLAEDAMKQTRLLVNNPRELAYEDAVRIYEQAW